MEMATISSALVVDADRVATVHVSSLLARCGVNRIVTAHDIATANSHLQHGVHLLLCEVVLGGEHCYPILCAARRQVNPVAIVAMSDKASRADVFQLRDYGAIAYLDKPLEIETLQACLQQITRGYEASNQYKNWQQRANVPSSLEEMLYAYERRFCLTRSEIEVLGYAMSGLSRNQIAKQRAVSLNTTKSQIRTLLEKTRTQTLRELVEASFAELQKSVI